MIFDFQKHKNIMLQILKDVYSDTDIAPYLGFKGGTAAFLFYGLSRDSVDLDFDLLDESKEQMVFEQLQKIAALHGKVVDSRMKKFNLTNVISYEAKHPRIKIEVNRRKFESQFEMIQKRLGISFRDLVGMCIEQLEDVNNRHILEGIGQLLTDSQKDWARAKLKEDTLFLLRARLESERKII